MAFSRTYSCASSDRRWFTAIALIAVGVLIYLRQLFLGQTFFLRDYLTYTLPSRDFLRTSFQAGNFPEWWDAVGLGIPFAANPGHGVLYPPAWIVTLFPASLGTDFLLAVHVLLAGFGVAVLSRRFGADATGSTLAGLLFMCCGYVASVAVNGIPILTLAWTPWVAWAADRVSMAQGGRRRWNAVLIFAGLFAVQIVSGDPAGYGNSGLLAAAIVLVRCRMRWQTIAAFVLGAGIAVVLAAVAVIPALFLLGESARAGGLEYAQATVWSLHPVRMLEWIWPSVLGTPGETTMDLAAVIATTSDNSGLAPNWSLSMYIGAPALVLVGIAARKHRGLAVLTIVSLCFVVLALGRYSPIYEWFRSVMVTEQYVRYPEKHMVAALVLWSSLSGVGFSILFGPRESRIGRWSMLISAIVFLLLLASVGVWRQQIAAWVVSQSQGSLDGIAIVHRALTSGLFSGLVFVVIGLSAWGVERKYWLKMGAWFALAAFFLQGILHAWEVQRLVSRDLVTQKPAILSTVPGARGSQVQDAPRPRIYRQRDLTPRGTAQRRELAILMHHTAVENAAAPYGFAYLPGYDPALSASLRNFWDTATETSASSARLLELLDIQYVVLPSDSGLPAGMRQVTEDRAGLTVYEQKNRRPRAFVAYQWQWHATNLQVQQAVFQTKSGDKRIHIRGTGQPGQGTHAISPCSVDVYESERVVLSCHAKQPGVAVLLDAWAPGWSVQVNSQKATLLRVDGLVRGVRVQPGLHTITFSYQTPGLRMGAGVSGIGWIAWAVLLVWCRPRAAGQAS